SQGGEPRPRAREPCRARCQADAGGHDGARRRLPAAAQARCTGDDLTAARPVPHRWAPPPPNAVAAQPSRHREGFTGSAERYLPPLPPAGGALPPPAGGALPPPP